MDSAGNVTFLSNAELFLGAFSFSELDFESTEKSVTDTKPPTPIKPNELRASLSGALDVDMDVGAAEVADVPKSNSPPSAFMQANPGGNTNRQGSIRMPPAPLKTSLSFSDMQDSPYIEPPATAPASSTLSSANTFSASPRNLRAPPPIPTTPEQKRSPSHFTFEEAPQNSVSDDSTMVDNFVEADLSLFKKPSGATKRASVSVGASYRSMLKSFQDKGKGPEKLSAQKESSFEEGEEQDSPSPLPSKRASTSGTTGFLTHSMSMGEELGTPLPAASPPQGAHSHKRASSLSTVEMVGDNGALNVNLPDEKNIQFYERNLHFFKKLKEVTYIFQLSFSFSDGLGMYTE